MEAELIMISIRFAPQLFNTPCFLVQRMMFSLYHCTSNITLVVLFYFGFKVCNEGLFTFQRLLQSFISRIFTEKSFESDFPLVLDVDGQKGKNIKVPEGIR